MAKSRCPICGKVLKSGEWKLRLTDGKVQKICNDRRMCNSRKMSKGG